MKAFVVFVAGALSAAPAVAQPMGGGSTGTSAEVASETQNATAPAANAAEDGERRICRRIDSSANRTGARRVCRTAAEWRNEQDSN